MIEGQLIANPDIVALDDSAGLGVRTRPRQPQRAPTPRRRRGSSQQHIIGPFRVTPSTTRALAHPRALPAARPGEGAAAARLGQEPRCGYLRRAFPPPALRSPAPARPSHPPRAGCTRSTQHGQRAPQRQRDPARRTRAPRRAEQAAAAGTSPRTRASSVAACSQQRCSAMFSPRQAWTLCSPPSAPPAGRKARCCSSRTTPATASTSVSPRSARRSRESPRRRERASLQLQPPRLARRVPTRDARRTPHDVRVCRCMYTTDRS